MQLDEEEKTELPSEKVGNVVDKVASVVATVVSAGLKGEVVGILELNITVVCKGVVLGVVVVILELGKKVFAVVFDKEEDTNDE